MLDENVVLSAIILSLAAISGILPVKVVILILCVYLALKSSGTVKNESVNSSKTRIEESQAVSLQGPNTGEYLNDMNSNTINVERLFDIIERQQVIYERDLTKNNDHLWETVNKLGVMLQNKDDDIRNIQEKHKQDNQRMSNLFDRVTQDKDDQLTMVRAMHQRAEQRSDEDRQTLLEAETRNREILLAFEERKKLRQKEQRTKYKNKRNSSKPSVAETLGEAVGVFVGAAANSFVTGLRKDPFNKVL